MAAVEPMTQRIDKLNAQIQALEAEKKKIQEDQVKKLSEKLIDLLVKNNALCCDQGMLVGGLLHVLDIIVKEDGDSKAQQDLWREEGVRYYAPKGWRAAQRKSNPIRNSQVRSNPVEGDNKTKNQTNLPVENSAQADEIAGSHH